MWQFESVILMRGYKNVLCELTRNVRRIVRHFAIKAQSINMGLQFNFPFGKQIKKILDIYSDVIQIRLKLCIFAERI